jgi:hypothetical protein
MTCEHCGADAVDAEGICENCGMRAGGSAFTTASSSPSLAETRPADIPAPANIPARARTGVGGTPTGFEGRGSNPPAARGGGGARSASVTTRYCGTCGAALEPGRQFCGQCGSPVTAGGASGIHEGTVFTSVPSGSGRYANPSGDGWAANDYDAPTEEQIGTPLGAPLGFGQSPLYARSGVYGAGRAASASPGMSRELRVLVGILCLLGGLFSAAGAIALAYLH